MNRAWHLRQDGRAFPVKVHIYCMEDDDLSSEAEAAAFIVSTKSKDLDIAEYTLDAWMALLIEQEVSYDADERAIEQTIKDSIESLPYKFQYPLNVNQLLDIHRKSKNYSDVDTLYDFIDKVRDELEEIQDNIKKSLNQQFCRVRYGGQYNSVSGNNEIWFRVSSVGFNWANVIYEYASSIRRSYKLESITICRDAESDGGFDSGKEYFYKAKDGALYQHMPIDEFFREEHEHSMYFESVDLNEGYITSMRKCLAEGQTYHKATSYLNEAYDVTKETWNYIKNRERKTKCAAVTVSDRLFPNRRKGF